MTISYVYKKITEAMQTIENINFIEFKTIRGRLENQKKVNQAYKMLDNIRAELERESIKNKQKRNEEQEVYK